LGTLVQVDRGRAAKAAAAPTRGRMAARATLEVRRVLDSMMAMRVLSSLCDGMNEK
jgi:hypothetical protein